jgi:hypothetical protein
MLLSVAIVIEWFIFPVGYKLIVKNEREKSLEWNYISTA